jgi:hypothetical protein
VNQEFIEARIVIVGCTLRCDLGGLNSSSVQFFQNNIISSDLEEGRFADPGIDDSWFEMAKYAMLLLGVISFFSTIFRKRRERPGPKEDETKQAQVRGANLDGGGDIQEKPSPAGLQFPDIEIDTTKLADTIPEGEIQEHSEGIVDDGEGPTNEMGRNEPIN